MKKSQKFYLVIKRIIGFFGSLAGILFCLPLLWWWVFLINLVVTKGHPVFISKRIGKNGKTIGVIKFRSMRLEIDPNLTSDEIKGIDRPYTWFGKLLRKSSVDETPQLLNIFIGQMAFIGPRPLIDIDGDHVTIELRKENGAIKLRPGLSGYAQISGRTTVKSEEKAKLDGYYFQNVSLCLDAKIFVITLLQVIGFCKKNKQN